MTDSCCDTSCPEPADVTINEIQLLADDALDLSVVNVGGPTGTTTAYAQVIDSDGDPVAGNYLIRFWLVDTNDKAANKSVVPPTTPGVNDLEKVTADDGSAAVIMSHTGAAAEWYICAELLGVVYIAGPINLGV